MPFPKNWLEELVIEWLDLEGFVTTTNIGVPAEGGGRWSPDVVGAKWQDEGKKKLLIRHCEPTMFLNQEREKVKEKFKGKFSGEIQDCVKEHFACIFGKEAVDKADYEKWVITFEASCEVQNALKGLGIKILTGEEFVRNEVLQSFVRYRKLPRKSKKTTLPEDKWLLGLIDLLNKRGLIKKADN
ncbi:MAG: hypothetical protein K6U10_03495 [Acidobacteriia bacterium]|nr:hypothetical protein [Methyloceanibacter sp.]MCL6490869.1 hypothetical protein [Terriglobia bacterium]